MRIIELHDKRNRNFMNKKLKSYELHINFMDVHERKNEEEEKIEAEDRVEEENIEEKRELQTTLKVQNNDDPDNSDENNKNNEDEARPKPASLSPFLTRSISSSSESSNPVFEETQRTMSVEEWLSSMRWTSNAFTFSIDPSLFVGYNDQMKRITNSIKEKHKISLVTGPTGSGKTMFLQRIALQNKYVFLYIGKPPAEAEEFVKIFNEKFRAPWYLRLFMPNIRNVYQIPEFLNKKLKGKHLVILFDEGHEAEIDVLEWLRLLSDQVHNVTIILSGLPIFEDKLRQSLESMWNRVTTRVELVSLTREETKEMIRKRINKVGGIGLKPFDDIIVENIYGKTHGYPREVIRLCDKLINQTMEEGRTEIGFIPAKREEVIEKIRDERISLSVLDNMTPMQRKVTEMLIRPLTPGQIADEIGTQKYKTRQHAVRSVNNILKDLMKEDLVERRRKDRAFVYELTSKVKTLVAKS